MARTAGRLISRASHRWLVRVSIGRDPETGTRKYHNKTVRGSSREAQAYLNARLQERDSGRLRRKVLSFSKLDVVRFLVL
jgi:integrase